MKKSQSQGQSIDFDQMLTFYKIINITKIIYSETREKIKNFDI